MREIEVLFMRVTHFTKQQSAVGRDQSRFVNISAPSFLHKCASAQTILAYTRSHSKLFSAWRQFAYKAFHSPAFNFRQFLIAELIGE